MSRRTPSITAENEVPSAASRRLQRFGMEAELLGYGLDGHGAAGSSGPVSRATDCAADEPQESITPTNASIAA